MLGVTDGTYNLHFGGWTLVSFGTFRLRYTASHAYQQKFYPMAFMFVRTETAFAYTKLFSVCKQRCQEFFGVTLDLQFGSLDHSTSIANAFQTVWSEIKLLDCWPHLDRNSRKKKGLLAERDRYNDIIKPQLDYLSQSRSKQQFEVLSALITQNWDDLGEGEYAAWLDTEYLTEPWDLWFYTASDVPGIVPNHNPHHHSIKTTAVNQLRASTGHVLASTLPKILVECAMEIGSEPIQHFAAGPVSAGALEAGVLLCNDDNHFPTHRRKSRRAIRNIQAYYFNQRYYIVRDDNVHGLKVNSSRTKTYESSLSGSVKDDEIVENVQLRYCSLHKVTVLDRLPYEHDWNSPLWLLEEINTISLQRDGVRTSQYSVDALVKRLVDKPASVINWSVLIEKTVRVPKE